MSSKFEDLYTFDARLLQAIKNENYKEPTLIQEKAIPMALQDKKDIVARAKTGSGKTAAYLVPIIQMLLEESEDGLNGNRCLILVPTKELSDQVHKVINRLIMYCGKSIQGVNIGNTPSETVQASLLSNSPNLIVSTPAKALSHVQKGNIVAKDIKHLVIDEADQMISLDNYDDLEELANLLPVKKTIQAWLMSATLEEDVETLKSKFCRNTAILKLDDDEDDNKKESLVQYYVKCSEFDKFLLAYVIFKLNLVRGKTIIFVNDVDRCYRLKLFFEQFGIKSAVLNSQLPIASRLHIVEEFNKNVYNIVIATDESNDMSAQERQEEEQEQQADTTTVNAGQADIDTSTNTNKNTKKNKNNSKDYGVSRGVDFINVACVLNFDLPTSSRAYTHRIGRTARANKSGMALSFVVPKDQWGKHKPSTLPTAKKDEKVLNKVIRAQEKLDRSIEPYSFDMKQVESFRYRMEDAFRAVTKVAIREAQVKEIKHQLLNSEKLQRHFEENPEDLAGLRHDNELHPARVQSHLKRVPDYLVKGGSGSGSKENKKIDFVGFHKTSENRIRKARKMRNHKVKKKDPLKSFKK